MRAADPAFRVGVADRAGVTGEPRCTIERDATCPIAHHRIEIELRTGRERVCDAREREQDEQRLHLQTPVFISHARIAPYCGSPPPLKITPPACS